jgi:hypothetical protein
MFCDTEKQEVRSNVVTKIYLVFNSTIASHIMHDEWAARQLLQHRVGGLPRCIAHHERLPTRTNDAISLISLPTINLNEFRIENNSECQRGDVYPEFRVILPPACGWMRPPFLNPLRPYVRKLGLEILRHYLVLHLNVQCVRDLDKHVLILRVDWYDLVIHVEIVSVTSNLLLLPDLFACGVRVLASDNVLVHVLALIPRYLLPILLDEFLYVGHPVHYEVHTLVLDQYFPGFIWLPPRLSLQGYAIQLRFFFIIMPRAVCSN